MPYYKLLEKAKRGDTSLSLLGLVELSIHQLWYVKQLFPRRDFRKTIWRGVVTWMCRKREAKQELEHFLEYVGACIERNRNSLIHVVFSVEKYEEVLEEFYFKVNGLEPAYLREEELLENVKKILLMTRPETDDGMDEELDYELEMKIPSPLVLPSISPDPDWCICVSKYTISLTGNLERRIALQMRTNGEGRSYRHSEVTEESEDESEDELIEESENESSDESENELVEESGNELVERSENELVEGSEYESVEGSENESVEGSEDESVEGSENELAEGPENELAEGPENESAEGSESEWVDGSESEWVDGSESESIDESENELIEAPENELVEESENELLEESENELGEESENELGEESEDELGEESENELAEESENELVEESRNEYVEESRNEYVEESENEYVEESENEYVEESENEYVEESENEYVEESENEYVEESENEYAEESENEYVEESENELVEDPLRETPKTSYDFQKVEDTQERNYIREDYKREFTPRYKRLGKLASKKVEELKKTRFTVYIKGKKSFREKKASTSGVKTRKLWPYDFVKEVKKLNMATRSLKGKSSLIKTEQSKLENAEKSVENTKYPKIQETKPAEQSSIYSYDYIGPGGMWPTKKEEPKPEKTEYLSAEQVEAALTALRTGAFVHCSDRKENQTKVKKVHFEREEKSKETGKVKGKPDIRIEKVDKMIKAVIEGKSEAKNAPQFKCGNAGLPKVDGKLPEIDDISNFIKSIESPGSIKEGTPLIIRKIDWSRIFKQQMEESLASKNSSQNPENVKKPLKLGERAELLVAKNVEEQSLQVGKTDVVLKAEAADNSSKCEKRGRRKKRGKRAKKSRAGKNNKEFSKLEVTFGQINLGDFLNV